MVGNLVTLAEARAHLRLDWEEDSGEGTGADDSWLDIFIPAISEAVAGWVKEEARLYVPLEDSSGEVVVDSSGEPVPAEPLAARQVVKAAVLVELASQYRFREGEGKDNVVPADAGHGYVLNKASTALLAPLRRSTVR
jgi:hypothetical protein